MKTFLFILAVWNGHDYSTFVIDYDISLEDCAALHLQWAPTLDDRSTVYCQ